MTDPERAFWRYLKRPTRRRLGDLVRAYHGLVWRVALRVTRHREDAADICQEVFLKLLLEPPDPGTVRSPEGWLIWRAIAQCTAARRRDERRRARERLGAERARAEGLAADDLEALREAVAGLPEDLRAVVELRYFAGLSNREAAEALGLSVRAVEDRLRRGRERLERKLGGAPSALAFLEAAGPGGPESTEAPPPGLALALLRIASRGHALRAAGPVTGLGGAALVKKAAVAAVALAVLGIGAAGGRAWWERRGARLPEPAGGVVAVETETALVPPPPEDVVPPATVESKTASARAAVRVTVLDEDAAPVPGAVVTWNRVEEESPVEPGEVPDPDGEVRAGDDGKCLVGGLEPGKYHVRAATATQRTAPRSSVRLAAGEEKELTVVVYVRHRLHGTVRDDVGNPLPGARVIFANHGEEEFFTAIGDVPACGVFTIDAAGRYDTGFRLVVSNEGRGDPRDVHVLAAGYGLATARIRKTQFQDREAELDFVLEPEMRILVRVVDPAGLPVAGARIGRVHDFLAFETDQDGRAVLANLQREPRTISASKEGYRNGETHVSPETAEEVTLILTPFGPGIEGRITFAEEIPEEDRVLGEIDLVSVNSQGEVDGYNASPGRIDRENFAYRYWPISPARYAVQRGHQGFLSVSPAVEFTGSEPVRADIHVRLEPPYVAGRVVAKEGGAPIGGVPVRVQWVALGEEHRSTWGRYRILNGFFFPMPPGNGRGVETTGDGKFLIQLPRCRERYLVTVRAGSGQAGRGEDLPLEIGPETAIADLRVELMARGAIAGEVRRDDGLPAANECVAAYDGLGALEHAQSGADGRYRIEGLRPGRYLVLPLGRVPFGPREGSGLSGDHSGLPSPLEFFSRALEVRGGETVRRDIDLGRERLPAIRGACGGLLPAAATIGYSFLHRGRPACAQGLRGDAHLEDRRFAIANLWPGPYALWIEGPDQVRLAEARVELELAETAEVTLEPPRAILVLPVEAAGGPVPASLAADAVERWSPAPTCADHEWDWEAWGGQTAMREGNALRVAGLPAGRVRVRVAARGYVPAWSEPVEIAEGSETRAPVLALDRGREIRVRLDPPEGVSLPETVQFTVRPAPAAEDAPSLPFLTERLPGEPVWVLSAFSPGDYEVRVSSEGFAEARLHAAVAADGDTELTAAFRRP